MHDTRRVLFLVSISQIGAAVYLSCAVIFMLGKNSFPSGFLKIKYKVELKFTQYRKFSNLDRSTADTLIQVNFMNSLSLVQLFSSSSFWV